MVSPQLLLKHHAVLLPYPAQGHINPMLKLAKLLHYKGFHITFVNTEFNHKRLLKARGPNALNGLPDFKFETIPDGLPPSEADATQDIISLCYSTRETCLGPFRSLLAKLNDSASAGLVPSVSSVIFDGDMTFSIKAAQELGVPAVLFWTASACGLRGYAKYQTLIDKGLIPLKDESFLTNGYLNTEVDWIEGMNSIRLKDLPTYLRTTDRNDFMLNFLLGEMERAHKATAIIINTFDEMESDVLKGLSKTFPPLYTVGPLHLLVNQIPQEGLVSFGSSLWKEETSPLEWLDSKEPNSVVYVNYGSIAVMTPNQLCEFAWGLSNSNYPFLWIIRPDLVNGGSVILSPEFVNETKERCLIAEWCAQEQVITHPSVGGFITHCGWNSTVESVIGGVPVLCWPSFAEQQTNCRYLCNEWGMGMEIDTDVRREEVTNLVHELMEGEKGKGVRKKAKEWKNKAEEATRPRGSSCNNFDKLVKDVLLK